VETLAVVQTFESLAKGYFVQFGYTEFQHLWVFVCVCVCVCVCVHIKQLVKKT
jgi:hypothetical protein